MSNWWYRSSADIDGSKPEKDGESYEKNSSYKAMSGDESKDPSQFQRSFDGAGFNGSSIPVAQKREGTYSERVALRRPAPLRLSLSRPLQNAISGKQSSNSPLPYPKKTLHVETLGQVSRSLFGSLPLSWFYICCLSGVFYTFLVSFILIFLLW